MEVLTIIGILILAVIIIAIIVVSLAALWHFWPLIIGLPLGFYIGVNSDLNIGLLIGIFSGILQWFWLVPKYGTQEKVADFFEQLFKGSKK